MKRSMFVVLLILGWIVLPSTAHAVMPSDDQFFEGRNRGSAAELLAGRSMDASPGSGSRGAGPQRVTLFVVGCPGNEPTGTAPVDVVCPQAAAMCDGTPAADMMFWIFSGPAGVADPTPDQWVRTGQQCMRPQDVPAAAIPEFTARDFRRLPLPPGGVRIEPPNLRTLINVPTNVYVLADVEIIDTTLLGFPVQVRATPERFRWNFGDRHSLSTEDAGAPYPDLRTTHIYLDPGKRDVVLTTVYSGEYSVDGGTWLPIDGTAEVGSPPTTLTVLSATNRRVAGPGG